MAGGRDPHDFDGPRRELREHRLARAAEQDRAEPLAQFVEVLVAEHPALLVDHPVAIEEPEGRHQPAVVDELDHRIELIEPIFQGRSGKHEGKRRTERFDDAGGLRFPVLDPLPLVENDQVPAAFLDAENVAEHLLVVADGEEAIVFILGRPLAGAAHYKLHVAVGKTANLVSPLRFHRSGADDQHLADLGLAGENLGHAHALDRLAQAHVVGQHRPARLDGEGDPVELIGEEFRLQQRLAQRMAGRVLANLVHQAGDPVLEQPPLDQFLGVGIDGNFEALLLEPPNAADQGPRVVDRPVGERAGNFLHFRMGLVGQPQMERQVFAVEQVHADVLLAVGPGPLRGREPLADAVQRVHDVFAGAQRVRAEVGATAIRLASLFPPQGDPVRLAGGGAGQQVVGPGPVGVARLEAEFLFIRPLLPLGQGLLDQLLLAQAFDRHAVRRRLRQAEDGLLLEDQRDGAPHVLAHPLAGRAIEVQPILGLGHQRNRHDRRRAGFRAGVVFQAEQIAAKIDIFPDMDLVGRPPLDQPAAVRAEKLAGFHVC